VANAPRRRAGATGHRAFGRLLARAAAVFAALALGSTPGLARQLDKEFWPEANLFYTLTDHSRLMLLGALSSRRDYPDAIDATAGLHLDLLARELPSWWRTALPSMEQRWGLWFRFGYNRIVSLDGPGSDENRWIAETTLRSQPLVWGIQLANRSRFESRDIGGSWSWRYRNRTRIERGFAPSEVLGEQWGQTLQGWGLAQWLPYAMLEFGYDSRYDYWRRRYQQYGLELEFQRDWGIDLYFAIQDDLRDQPRSVRALGVVLNLRY
jgi:hypothetical protein